VERGGKRSWGKWGRVKGMVAGTVGEGCGRDAGEVRVQREVWVVNLIFFFSNSYCKYIYLLGGNEMSFMHKL
jgi:hypothetical protein